MTRMATAALIRNGGEGVRSPAGRIAMFVPTLVGGGAERVMLTLAHGFLGRGHAVDVVMVKAEGALVTRIPPGARVIELGTRRVILSVPALARYLRREQPVALLSTLDTANVVAVVAARIARQSTRVAIRQANHLSRSLERASVPLLSALVRWSYPHADAVIAVSSGVAEDLAERLGLRRARIHVVPNPIVTRELVHQAGRPLDHAWFAADAPPVVLGVGRLTEQKRFDVLIQAFALARARCEARLMILGEGEELPRLQGLIRELRLEEVVSLQGFVDNPFPYMARSRVFVLSSDWEGLPGALIQALACGTPIVATDCDSGPREILQEGRLGRLVPVGDVAALADAISTAVREPRMPLETDACLPYTESAAVETYLRILHGHRDG